MVSVHLKIRGLQKNMLKSNLGRDPASIETMFFVPLIYPDLAEPVHWMKELQNITGSPEVVATSMHEIEELGASQ